MKSAINKFIKSETFRNIYLIGIRNTIIRLFGLFVTAKLIVFILDKTVFKYSKLDKNLNITLKNLTENIVYIVFTVMGIFTILEACGINTSSLLATAGIGGIAIGFGVQSLVKDIITGFFILIEGQYYVGDEVRIDGVLGRVVEFGIKSTKIQDYETGAIHIYPNGTIQKVENRSKVDQYSIVNIDVPEEYDIDKLFNDVESILEYYIDDSRVVEHPRILGMVDGPERYNRLFVRAVVKNGFTYEFSRDMRRRIYNELAKLGYTINSPLIIAERVD